jgi:hypothetical protein
MIESSASLGVSLELDGAIGIDRLHCLWWFVHGVAMLSILVFGHYHLIPYSGLIDVWSTSSIFFLIILYYLVTFPVSYVLEISIKYCIMYSITSEHKL